MKIYIKELLQDPNVYAAWQKYGSTLSFEDWVLSIVKKYQETSINFYA
jgi:hypothetical protein